MAVHDRSRARSARHAAAIALLAAGWLGCRDEGSRPAASKPPPELVDLDASLASVRAEFNAHRGENRFLTLLAPT